MSDDRQDIVDKLREVARILPANWLASIRANEAADEITALRADNERLRKDAERYAFLRSVKTVEWSMFNYHNPLYRDAAIDAALANRPAEGES